MLDTDINGFDADKTAMTEKRTFVISMFERKNDVIPKEKTITWGNFAARIKQPFVRGNKDGAGFSPCVYEPKHRLKNNVGELSMLIFDVDAQITIEALRDKLLITGAGFFIYSTHSHLRETDKNPNAGTRWRVCIPLAEPVPVSEFENLWQTVNQVLQLEADQNARDVSRMHYSPCKAGKGAAYEYHIEQSEMFFDWRGFLARYSRQAEPETNRESSTPNAETARQMRSFDNHEDRNHELQRIIEQRGKQTRTGFQMKCPAHNGTGDTSLFSAADSPAVKCRNNCDYFKILRAFGLSDESLPSRDKRMTAKGAKGANGEDREDDTKIELLPVADEKCFRGLAGDFVRIVAPESESNDMALLVQFLIYFGSIIGRNAHFKVEADKHFTNTFAVMVGNTSAGRKGISFGRVKQVFQGIDEHFERDCIVSGLASGEGLIYHVRDAVEETKTDKKTGLITTVVTDNGVADKRLLVYEGEFAQVLRVQKRETNTLSAVLRNFWDTGTHRNMSKNSPLRTTNAHVSTIAHITKDELLVCLDEIEAANGGLNRYLFVWVRRSKFLPLGGDLPAAALNDLRMRLQKRIAFARNVERMAFAPDAARLWISQYQRLETSRTGYLAQVTQRASPYVLRLSCIVATLDGKAFIEREHLETALAIWQYCEDSARYIFGNRTGDKLTDDVLALLRQAGRTGMTKTEINNATGNYYKAQRINAALQTLHENVSARFTKEILPNAKKPTERWFYVEMSEFPEFNRGDDSINSGNSDISSDVYVDDDEREVFEI